MNHAVIFEKDSYRQLRMHEINAIMLLLDYFNCEILCLQTNTNKSPDLKIQNLTWELKSPKGNSPKTIENILRKAEKQSQNIILDFTRIKMPNNQALARTRFFISKHKHQIKRLIIIMKNQKIIDITNEL